MNDKKWIVTGLVVFLVIVLFPFWFNRGKAVPPPDAGAPPDPPGTWSSLLSIAVDPGAAGRGAQVFPCDVG